MLLGDKERPPFSESLPGKIDCITWLWKTCSPRSNKVYWPLYNRAYVVDCLDWGPQNVDLQLQELLRYTFFRTAYSSIRDTDDYMMALASGSQTALLCEPYLGNCLAILWLLESLAQQHVNMKNCSLVFLPPETRGTPPLAEQIDHALATALPASDVLLALQTIRRHIASDSADVYADLSALPPVAQEWASISHLLNDLLPDERGLDLIDELLLQALAREDKTLIAARTETWPTAAMIIGSLSDDDVPGHCLGVTRLWERILEHGGVLSTGISGGIPPQDRLLDLCFEGGNTLAQMRLRLTALGKRVLAGREDALVRCPILRWVGGRMVSAERPLRRAAVNLSTGNRPTP